MKTTRLIGSRCKHGDVFSQAVLIDRGLDHILKGTPFARSDYSVLRVCPQRRIRDEKPESGSPVFWPVSITVRSHLFPFRTQKLSSLVPKIVGWKRPVKIGSRRLLQRKRLNHKWFGRFFHAPKPAGAGGRCPCAGNGFAAGLFILQGDGIMKPGKEQSQ